MTGTVSTALKSVASSVLRTAQTATPLGASARMASSLATKTPGQTNQAGNIFEEANKAMGRRSYHTGDTPTPLAKVLGQHAVASKLLQNASFQYPGLCHFAHPDTAIKAAGGEETGSYTMMKAATGSSDSRARLAEMAKSSVMSALGSGPDAAPATPKPKLTSDASLYVGGTLSSEDLEQKVKDRGLVVINGYGVAADDSKQSQVGNPGHAKAAMEMGQHRIDNHSKIIFSVGSVSAIAPDFGVDESELSGLTGLDKDTKVVVAFDMDPHRMTPKMDELLEETGLERDELHRLPAEQLLALGADEVMLSIAPLADFEKSFEPILSDPISSQMTGPSMSWPDEETAALLKGRSE